MQLGASGSITPAALRGLCRFLTNSMDNTAAFSDTNIDALLNLEQKTLQTEILAALNFDWKENTLDGSGSGSVTLTEGDNSTAFPTDMLEVDRIEVSYTGNTNSYRPVTIVKMQSITGGLTNTSDNAPIKGTYEAPIAYIRNKVIILDPIPYQTVSGGMKIWGVTLVEDLSDTTDAPVFESAFHEILAYGPSATWCLSKEKGNKAASLLTLRKSKFDNMVSFYSTRVATEQPILIPKSRSMR